MADRMPIDSASGTETRAVTAANIREFGNRLAISSATGKPLTSDVPGSPVARLASQWI